MPARQQLGVPFEIIPKGRDKVAAIMYRYLRWHTRRYRATMISTARTHIRNALLYGHSTEPIHFVEEDWR